MMFTQDDLNKYPLCKKLIFNWYIKKMIESFKGTDNVTDEEVAKAAIQMVDEGLIVRVINNTPRLIFDVLDENDVKVSIFAGETAFRYSFDGGKVESIDYSLRKLAELDALSTGLEMLEDKLQKANV